MWVIKQPKRFDFCGSPPCSLCFDWVEPNPPDAAPDYIPETVDGLQKMSEDVLGKGVVPTEDQRKQLYEAAERIHVYNLNKPKTTPEQAHKDTIDDHWTRREVEGFLTQKRKEQSVVRPKVLTAGNTLDEIADKKEEKPEKEEKEKVKKKVKENQEAPIDYGLLRRETKNSAAAREAMIRRAMEDERIAMETYFRKMYGEGYKSRSLSDSELIRLEKERLGFSGKI